MHMSGHPNVDNMGATGGGVGIYAANIGTINHQYLPYKFYLYGSDNSGLGSNGCYGRATGNAFYDCPIGVSSKDYYHLKAEYSNLSSRNSLSTLGSNRGLYGYFMQSKSYYDVQLNYNNMNNIPTGIVYNASLDLTGSSINGEIHIAANAISPSAGGPPTAYGEYVDQAISVNGMFIDKSGAPCQGAQVNIQNNALNSVFNGIHISGFKTYIMPVNVNSNTISMIQSPLGPSLMQKGIEMQNIDPGYALLNVINGPGAAIPTPNSYINPAWASYYSAPGLEGIHVENLTGGFTTPSAVGCNTINNINTGFYLQNGPFDWVDNIMNTNAYGMVLKGTIGAQGSLSTYSGNQWTGPSGWWNTSTSTPNYQTYTVGGALTNPLLSPLFVDPSNNPIFNGNDPGTVDYTSAGAVTAYASGTFVSCPTIPGPIPMYQYKHHGNDSLKQSGVQSYTLYPNPSDGNITIKQGMPDSGPVSAEIWNVVGQKIFNGILTFNAGEVHYVMSNNPPGLYVLNLTDNKGQKFVLKFTIK